jgi:prepilin-type N-terminal cleavage/methylation domain-containing protein
MKKINGFTLVELLIVMAVLAILISITIISFKGMQDEARKAKAQGDVKTLKVAIESYYKNNNNVYPSQADYEQILLNSIPRIIENFLYDPFGQTSTSAYKYALSGSSPADSNFYIIYSLGTSGKGMAMVDGNGTVTVSFDAIYETNAK